MTIRRANLDDLQRIGYLSSQIQTQQYQAEPAIFLKPERVTEQDYRAYWTGMLSRKDVCLFVADVKGKVQGYVSAQFTEIAGPFTVNKKIGRVGTIVVSESCRGIGIGKQLSEQAESWLKSLGAEDVILEVLDKNQSAKGFYRAQGYRTYTQLMSKAL